MNQTERTFDVDYDIQLKNYWYSIRRHSRLVLFCTLFSIALMVVKIETEPDLYRSSTKILIENQGQVLGKNSYYRFPQPVDPDIIKQWIMSSSVINKTNSILQSVSKTPETASLPPLSDNTIIVDRGNFSITFPFSKRQNRGPSNQCLAIISATSRNKKAAKLMAEAIVQAFRSQLMDNQLQQSRESLIWMTERLADQKKKVEEAEKRFQEYKQKIMVLSFEDQQAEESRKVMSATNELNKLQTQRLQLQVELNKLKSAYSRGPAYSDIVFQSQNIKSVKSLLSKLNNLESELQSKSMIFKEKHPKILEIKQNINNLRQQIETEKQHSISSLSIQIQTLRDREKVLQNSIDQYKENAHDIAQKELQYRILEREVQTNSELYNSLLAELKRTDLKGKIESTTVTVIEPPREPSYPVPKKLFRDTFLALILGAFIGISLALLIDYFEPTIRTPEDVERYLGISVVGMIPEKD